MEDKKITTLFLDIGNVLLTNGWDRKTRRKASELFEFDHAEMDERHHLTFDTYEEGKLSLEEYLYRILFYEPRPFTKEQFIQFMLAQSQPFQEMIDLVCGLKQKYNLRMAVVSNEGRELTTYRIKKFNLDFFVDFFIVSSFVHIRKPDRDIFKMALDVSQAEPERVLYIEDRDMFVEIAQGMGIRGIKHRSYEDTCAKLAFMGLDLNCSSGRGPK